MNKHTLWAAVVIAVVVAGGYWYWLSRTEAPQASLANPASVNCVQKLGGTLQIVDAPQGQEGLCHLPDGHMCEEWALFRGEDCTTFYIATVGHYMLLDQGTAPPPRTLLVFDLSLGTTTYTDMYNQPTEVGSSTFSYWQPIAAKPTAATCPELATWTSQGLGAGLERHVSLDLATLKLSDLGEQRCAARQ